MGGGATITIQNCEVVANLAGAVDISFDNGSVLTNPSDTSNVSLSFSSFSLDGELDPEEDGPYGSFGSDVTYSNESIEFDGPWEVPDGFEVDIVPRQQEAAAQSDEGRKRREEKDRLHTFAKVKWQSLSLKDLECADQKLGKALKNYEGKPEKEALIKRFMKEVQDAKVGKSK